MKYRTELDSIGKIKVDNLTLNQSKDILHSTLSKYYTNTDLQIKIEQFNSSKVYILGAVRNQITINLDQKPIRLIDAAIQASFNQTWLKGSFKTYVDRKGL